MTQKRNFFKFKDGKPVGAVIYSHEEVITEKRFKMKKLEYESYFIDSQQEYVDEDEPNFKIDGEKTMSDSQILDLLNENEQLKKQLASINRLIDNKIDEFKKGDYGDLPCNTIHMFLDLKQELGDLK